MSEMLVTDNESLTKNLVSAMEHTIEHLIRDGLLDEDKAIKFAQSHTIILLKPSWVTCMMRKLLGNDDKLRVQIVKIEHIKDRENEK